MKEQSRDDAPEKSLPACLPDTVPALAASPDPTVKPNPEKESAAANQLTPEEQMAAFEKELKENDWGHQPC